MDARSLIAVVVIGTALAGCKGEKSSSSDSAPPPIADLFAGPIPECMELLAPARRDYRVEANKQCLAATSLDARLKSPGCLARQEIGRCLATDAAPANSFGVEQIKAEEKAARAMTR